MPEKKLTRKERDQLAQVKPSVTKTHVESRTDNSLIKRISLGVTIFAGLLYINTYFFDYTHDDFSVIKENTVVNKGTSAIPTIFKTSYRHGYMDVNDGLYRPLSLMMFAIEWNIAPDTPALGHLINILLYALTAFVLFKLLCRLFQGYTLVFPLLVTLFFIAHPLHTEITASIKSRDEILCFLFSIVSLRFLFVYVDQKNSKMIGWSLVFLFLALLSKETAVIMLAIIPLTLYYFSPLKFNELIKTSCFYLLPLGIFLLIRYKALSSLGSPPGVIAADNLLVSAKDLSEKLATAFYVLGYYIKLLVFPSQLLSDYSAGVVELTNWKNIISIVSVCGYLALGIYAIISLRKKDIIGYGILFFLISIALFSNVFITIGALMAERFLYFPSFGFCIVLAWLIIKISKTEISFQIYPDFRSMFQQNKPVLSGAFIILTLYSIKTISRNSDWKDNYSLYSKDAAAAPENYRLHFYLGRQLTKQNAVQEQDSVKRAALYARGTDELNKAVTLNPTFIDGYRQLAVAYTRMKDYDQAEKNYLLALKYEPDDFLTLNNLGGCYGMQGKFKQATEIFHKALKVQPGNTGVLMNLSATYGYLGDKTNADLYYNQAIAIDPALKRNQ